MTALDPAQTPIVLIHGWAGSSTVWDPILPALRAAGHRGEIVAVDLPGSPAAPRGGTATIPGAVAATVEVLSALGRPSLVVGHSMGGQISLLAHAWHPDLVAGEVVIDPAYGAANEEREQHLRRVAEIERTGPSALSGFFTSGFGGLDTRTRQRILTDLSATPAAALASYLRSEYLDEGSIGFTPSTRRAAAGRSRPVFALHSSPRGEAAELALGPPTGSRVHRWDGHGHFLHLEDPSRFADEVTTWMRTTWN